MDQFRIAITWGLKEPAYASSPFLPDFDNQPFGNWEALSAFVADCHALHGTEISFYWCFPFWVLAAYLQPRGISVAGLAEFGQVGPQPDLIVLVDLPVRRSDFDEVVSRFPGVPVVLLVAETPLERQAQHHRANFEGFAAVMSYNSLLMKKIPQGIVSNLPFRFHRPKELELQRLRSPLSRSYCCTYIGNAHSSGWRRNFQYNLGWRGWPLLWQYLQGWRLPLSAAWHDERFGAYGARAAAVLAARHVFGDRFRLSGQGWGSGGSGWFRRWFPDRRLNLQSQYLGVEPGSKIAVLSDSTFTLVCENYLGEPGYVSEKLFDAMSAGSIPIYIGAKGSLPRQFREFVIDLSDLPRHALHSTHHLTLLLRDVKRIPQHELQDRQQRCLAFMDRYYEVKFGLGPFLHAFDQVLERLIDADIADC
tara:strand:+ start:256 stop:1515 length:1260 start_codon:yes stop_codon:yes gene_type:complete